MWIRAGACVAPCSDEDTADSARAGAGACGFDDDHDQQDHQQELALALNSEPQYSGLVKLLFAAKANLYDACHCHPSFFLLLSALLSATTINDNTHDNTYNIIEDLLLCAWVSTAAGTTNATHADTDHDMSLDDANADTVTVHSHNTAPRQ